MSDTSSKINKEFEELFGFINETNEDVSASDVDRAEEQIQSLNEKFRQAELDRYNQDTEHRHTLSIWAAVVVSIWLVSVLLILTSNKALELSDTVLSVLLGTTTLNVLGLMAIVLTDLFSRSKKDNKGD